MNTPTHNEIATDYNLWGEYIDPSNTTTEAEFDSMTIDKRIAIIVACGYEDE